MERPDYGTPTTTPTRPEAAHKRSRTTASKISCIPFVYADSCLPSAHNDVQPETGGPEYLSTGYRGFESLLLRFLAGQHFSTLRLRLRFSAPQLPPFQPRPASRQEPLPAAIPFYARGEATEGLAEVLRGGGAAVLTSGARRAQRAEMLTGSKK
jgi:hypothetical protein